MPCAGRAGFSFSTPVAVQLGIIGRFGEDSFLIAKRWSEIGLLPLALR